MSSIKLVPSKMTSHNVLILLKAQNSNKKCEDTNYSCSSAHTCCSSSSDKDSYGCW